MSSSFDRSLSPRSLLPLARFVVVPAAAAAFLACFAAGRPAPATLLLILAVGVVAARAARTLRALAPLEGVERLERFLLVHAVLHAAPTGYLAFRLWLAPQLGLAWAWYVPVLLFFWAGRRTWTLMEERSGKRIYRLFRAGNTGVPLMLTVLLALATAGGGSSRLVLFDRLLTFYFVIHLALGPGVLEVLPGHWAKATSRGW